MWIGVLWTDNDDEQVLLAYTPDRILVLGGPLTGLAHAAVTLRAAATAAGPALAALPRCAHCGAGLGLPDLDGLGSEGSACACS